MKIPNKTRIAGREYKTEHAAALNDGNHMCYGSCNWEKGVISINSELQDHEGKCITYLHEVLHILLHNANFKIDKEEELVISLSQGLYQVLQDNARSLYDIEAK